MKNIVVLTNYQKYNENRIRVETFEEAYEIMKKHYISNEYFSEDEWKELYPKDKIKAKFEVSSWVEFCDSDCIETLEQFLADFF